MQGIYSRSIQHRSSPLQCKHIKRCKFKIHMQDLAGGSALGH